MGKTVRDILQAMQKEYGESIFLPENRRRFNALLKDLTKNQFPREAYLAEESLRLGIWAELKKDGVEFIKKQNLCFQKLTDFYCMTEDGARYAVDLWSDVIKCAARFVPQVLVKKHVERYRSRREIRVPDGVRILGEKVFADWPNLERIGLPESLTAIDKGAFCLCRNLKEVVIPANVKKIGSAAFWGCTHLRFVALPSSVDHIGSFAFDDCAKELLIQCKSGSYAATYCRSRKLRTREVQLRQAN